MSGTCAAEALGYDPHPSLNRWRGTPIPPIRRPLPRTEKRWEIADRVWWGGPPWTILRNASWYLWHVMDYGRDADVRHALEDLPAQAWRRALDEARPGLLSKGSYVLWSLVFGRIEPGAVCGWPDNAHRLDAKPLAGQDRERLIRRHLRPAEGARPIAPPN